MRKIFTLVILTMMAFVTTKADELKIGVNDSKNDFAPVYTTQADRYYCSQIIYTASDLVNMKGKEITKLAFFLRSVNSAGDYTSVEIRLMKSGSASFSSNDFLPIDDAVLVFNGTLPASKTTELEVELLEPYLYESGHLLVDVRKTVGGGFYSSNASQGRFQSTFSEGASTVLCDYSASGVPTTANKKNGNRPDIRFTYREPVVATCAKPINLKIADLGENASFEWAAGAEETQWQALLVPKGEEADWSKASLVSEPKATVAVLPSNNYTFFVRAFCSESDQSEAAKIEFQAPCVPLAELPYEEDFEMVYGEALSCWELFQAGEYPCIGSASGLEHGGSSYLWFKGGKAEKQMAILPAFEKPINKLKLSFWNNSVIDFTGRANIEIGYLTNAADSASFVSCKTLDCYTTYTLVEFSFNQAPAEAQRIALRYANATADYGVSTYVDDLRVEEITGEPTGVENAGVKTNAAKRIENGHLIIEQNGVKYNAQGAVVK